MEVKMALLPISVGAALVVTLCGALVLWPITIKPALRRRYERAHHRRKATRAALDRRDRA